MSKSFNYGQYEQYQATKSLLERETATLIAERSQLQYANPPKPHPNPSIQHVYPDLTVITPVLQQTNQNEQKTQEVVNKLHEIIRLCKQGGALSNDEMREVVRIQTQVLNYLQKTAPEPEMHIVRPTNESPKQVRSPPEMGQSPLFPELHHTWGKEPQTRAILSEDTLEIIGEIERKALGEIMHLQQERDVLKREKDSLFAQVQRLRIEISRSIPSNIQIVPSAPRSYPGQIQKIREDYRIYSGQIQRLREENKVLIAKNAQSERVSNQCKFLRQENQFLATKLQGLGNITHIEKQAQPQRIDDKQLQAFHQQIERLNQQNNILRQENHYLNTRLQALANPPTLGRQAQKIDNRSTHQDYPQDNRNKLIQGQYDSQIVVYENELRRASTVINELRSRLAHVPGLQELHEQGERIRRQTTELLQLKGSGAYHSHDAALIRELQERLEQEQRGKSAFLEQLKSFKQRYIELEEQNRALRKSKVSFDPVPRPLGSTPPRESNQSRGIMKKRTSYLGDYEQTLNQLKQVLY